MKMDKRYIRVILYIILNKKLNINNLSVFTPYEDGLGLPINIFSYDEHLSSTLLNLCGLTKLRHYRDSYCSRFFHILKFTDLPKEREDMISNIYKKEVNTSNILESDVMLGYNLSFFGLQNLHD